VIITQIEQAIIDRANAVNAVANLGQLLKTVDRYSGEFSSEDLQLLITMAPFVLVSHTGSQAIQETATGSRWDGEFTVICGTTSRRGRAQAMASRVGGPASSEVGSRQFAELMRDILHGQKLGLPIKALAPISLDEVYSGQAGGAGSENFLSITGLRLATTYSTTRSTIADSPSAGLEEIVGIFAAQLGTVTIDDPDNNTVTIPLPEEQS
jgi:phage gp37-like protein